MSIHRTWTSSERGKATDLFVVDVTDLFVVDFKTDKAYLFVSAAYSTILTPSFRLVSPDSSGPMTFIAHTENPEGKAHLLSDHLRGVGNLAREFAIVANPEMAEAADWAGLLHDSGPIVFLKAHVFYERSTLIL